MMLAKRKVIGAFILLVLVITGFSSCGRNEMESEFADFRYLIENDEYLRLTIYFRSPLPFPPNFAIDVERLTSYPDSFGTRRYVIDNVSVAEHSDLFYQLSNFEIVPNERGVASLDVRIYYVFENLRTRQKFEVVIGGCLFDSIYVNEIEIDRDEFFYDVVIPFLPEDAVHLVEVFLGRREFYN